MNPITFCAHRKVLIVVAIGSDLRFAGSTLNFNILYLHFGPCITPRIPHSCVVRKTYKLMPQANRPSRLSLRNNMIVDTHTLTIQVFLQNVQG